MTFLRPTPMRKLMSKTLSSEQNRVWQQITGEPGNYYMTASDSERQLFRDWVRDLLQEREVTVDFVKADGDFRSMKCTLNQDLGAKYSMTQNKNPRKPNPDVCVVWDVAQSAWRSFRWDRIKRIQFDLG
jgi:hypothetical protein